MTRNDMIDAVDTKADTVRQLVVGNPVRTFEYQWAEQEATAFRDAGYSGPCGASVVAWADAKGWTNEQAADDILAAATLWRELMAAIRTARLAGKEGVRQAVDDDAATTAFETAMGTLESIRQQAGV